MKKLHELLDIDDELEEAEVEVLPAVVENRAVDIGGSVEPEQDAEDIKLDADFIEAIDHIKDVIDVAKDAVEKVANIATDSEDDKDFNALNNLLNTIVNASEKTIGLYAKKMEYKEKKRKLSGPNMEAPKGGVHMSIDKAVFTGTLDQLATKFEEAQKEEGGE